MRGLQFNCGEAVNFATSDWVRYGVQCVQRYRQWRRPSPLSHDHLMWRLAKHGEDHTIEECELCVRWLRLRLCSVLVAGTGAHRNRVAFGCSVM